MAHPSQPRVFWLSIDGLRPEFYCQERWNAPRLHQLAAHGAHAEAVISVFPSLTYPAHASLVTGALPANHGIISNTVFSWEKGPQDDWLWESRHFRIRPIWEQARNAGLSVATIRWPTTLGAKIDWLIPEIFVTTGYEFDQDWKLLREHSRPHGLVDQLASRFGASIPRSMIDLDRFAARAALELWEHEKPDLLLLHLVGLDHAQHHEGPQSEKTQEHLAAMDRLIGGLIDVIDFTRDTLFITGDHGFLEFDRRIHLNTAFVRNAWIELDRDRVRSWRAIAHCDSGQAAIYVKDHALEDEVRNYLAELSPRYFRLIAQEELKQRGAYPKAFCALESRPGYAFGNQLTGELIEPQGRIRGVHGQTPDHPELNTGLIMAGPNIPAGEVIGRVPLVEIGPKVARVLGFELETA